MKKIWMIAAAVLLLVTGCSNQTDNDKTVKETTKEKTHETASKKDAAANQGEIETKIDKAIKEAPPIPTSTKELINQYAGPFSGVSAYSEAVKAKFEKAIKGIQPLPENASTKDLNQLFNFFYTQVAEDFPDPGTLLKKWQLYSFGNPDLPDDRYQFKPNNNIEIILDASGSMAGSVDGKTKMELAKEAINKFLASAPKDAKISLRVYGHKGSNSDADKNVSCSSSELIYGSKAYNQAEFSKVLNQFQPSGWTPIADSLKKAKADLASFDSKTNTNLVFLVSDGIETCEGNPVAAAKELASSTIAPIVNVIGFDVDQQGQKQMREVADAADGIYTTVNNQEELQAEFDKAKEILQRWEDWKNKALSDADYKETERSFEILDFSNDWYFMQLNQGNNLDAFFTELFIRDVITKDQERYLKDKQKAMEDVMKKSLDEVEADLKNLNAQTLTETKKTIEEKYTNNTQ